MNMQLIMKNNKIATAFVCLCGIMNFSASCSGNKQAAGSSETIETMTPKVVFNADSAYEYVRRQTLFGPRVPNTPAHRECGDWLEAELRRHGAEVVVQNMELKAFDGTLLHARNIMGSYNPSASDRLLLLAHWDTRPWADNDPDESNHSKANDGANDGASGVGVLLETARALQANNPQRGVDILFVDAEDWGSHTEDDSWALGAEYFVKNPVREGYRPSEAILLDMVGGRGSRFLREYQSQYGAPQLNNAVWTIAAQSGFGNIFVNRIGGAVTDDHIKFLEVGIPAIDIIAYDPNTGTGFHPTWHTMYDTMDNIDAEVLGSVGQVILNYIYR